MKFQIARIMRSVSSSKTRFSVVSMDGSGGGILPDAACDNEVFQDEPFGY